MCPTMVSVHNLGEKARSWYGEGEPVSGLALIWIRCCRGKGKDDLMELGKVVLACNVV